jgi:hypothetical protein
MVATNKAIFTPGGLQLNAEVLTEGAAFAVFGVNVTAGVPRRLDVTSLSMNETYIAVSDYSAGHWHWLGDAYNFENALLPLPQGPQYVGPDGKLYVALVVPPKYSGVEECRLSVYIQDAAGDNTPPAWTGNPGIAAVTGFGPIHFEFNPVDDASAPVRMALFGRPALFGIDWRFPDVVLDPADYTAGYDLFDYYELGRLAFGAQAMDAAGNLTANTNTFEFSPNSGEPPPLTDTVGPGQELVLTWDDPAHDLDMFMSAPNYDEASRLEPELVGRSFIMGENSTASGLAEEHVWLTARPPDGGYIVIVQWNSAGSGSEAPRLRQYWPHGGLKHDFGTITALGPSATGERDAAILWYARPPEE